MNNYLWFPALAFAALLVLAGCAASATPTPTTGAAKPTALATTPATLVPTAAAPTAAPKPAALATPASPATTAGAPTGKELAASKFCARCHGASGEGGFGPVLAGTQATAAQAVTQVRTPRNKMPMFNDKQVSDAEIGSIVDYYRSQPKPATPGTYQFSSQAGDPAGKAVFVDKGCANCHGIPPNVAGTKLAAAEEITQVRTPRARMGAFNARQISDAEITSANEWLRSLPPPAPAAAPQPTPTR